MSSRRNHRRRMSVRFHPDEVADRAPLKRPTQDIDRLGAILDSIPEALSERLKMVETQAAGEGPI